MASLDHQKDQMDFSLLSLGTNGSSNGSSAEPSISRSPFTLASIQSLNSEQTTSLVSTLLQENRQLKEVTLESNQINCRQLDMINHLEKERDELETVLQTRMEKAKSVIESLTSKNQSLQQQLKARESRTASSESETSVRSLDLDASGSEIAASADRMSPEQGAVTHLKLQCDLLRTQLVEMEAQRDTVLQGRADADARCSELEEQLAQEQTRRQRIQTEKAEILTMNNHLMQKIEEMKKESLKVEPFSLIGHDSLHSEDEPQTAPKHSAEAVQGNSTQQSGDVDLRRQLEETEAVNQTLQREMDALYSRLRQLSETCDALQEKNEQRCMVSEEFRPSQLDDATAQVVHLQNQVAELSVKLSEGRRDMVEAASSRRSQETELKTLYNDIDKLRDELKEAKRHTRGSSEGVHASKMREERDVAMVSLSELRPKLEMAIEKLRVLEGQKKTTELRLQSAEEKLAESHEGRRDMVEAASSRRSQETELKTLYGDNDKLRDELKEAKRNTSGSSEGDALKQELQECKANFDRVVCEYEKLVDEHQSQQAGVMQQDRCEKELREARQQIQNLLADVRRVSEKEEQERCKRVSLETETNELRERVRQALEEGHVYQQQAELIGEDLKREREQLEQLQRRYYERQQREQPPSGGHEDPGHGQGSFGGAVGGTPTTKVIECPICSREFQDETEATAHVNWCAEQ